MIPLLIIGTLIWIVVQTSREKNLLKWKARFAPAAPVVRVFKGDVLATVRLARDWRSWPQRRRERREMRGWSAPDDLSGI